MKNTDKPQSGFTLLELMITVGVIGIITVVAIPAYNDYVTKSRLTVLALRLDNIADLLKVYNTVHGEYPIDSHITPPPGITISTSPDGEWYKDTELGGNFNWEGPRGPGRPGGYTYAAISIFEPTATTHEAELFDQMIDDGDLTTGVFQFTSNSRYTYIIEDGF